MLNLLKGYEKSEVEYFKTYIEELRTAKVMNKDTKQWENKNPWALKKDNIWFAELFKKNALTKLRFDGKHIIITNRGLSYDYIAYKNRLLIAYPETELSFSEVYQGDEFTFSQTDKGVTYRHNLMNPFNRETNKIIGAYCVIKNKRGNFLTLLDKKEIEKHKAIAKTKTIWNKWELEMILKTIIKKATRIHFEDIYEEINEEENKDIDITQKIVEEDTITSVDIAKMAQKKGINIDAICNSYKVKELKDLSEEQINKAYKRLSLSEDKEEEKK